MALNPVDKLLGGYLLFVTAVIVSRGPFGDSANAWMLLMHALFGVLLFLLTRLTEHDRIGKALHTLYPLIMLLPFYAQIGLVNAQISADAVYANDAVIQGWEDVLFGGQVSYTWIRDYPSIFWSGVLHLAYIAYYPIVVLGPVLLVLSNRSPQARSVLFATMAAFVVCYVAFILFPVAGPNYAFEHPTGPVREVWSARMVYGILAGGSSFGAAFPSSHVAATVAATLSTWRAWPILGRTFIVPAILLVVGTVYCQMHYGIDASSGVLLGVAGFILSTKVTT